MISTGERGHRDARAWTWLWLWAALICSAPVAETAAQTAALQIALADSCRPSAELNRLLDEDRRWLRNNSSLQLSVPPADSLSSLLEWTLRSAPLPAADTEAVRSARPLSSLLRDRWLERGYLAAAVDTKADTKADTDAGARPTLVLHPGPPFRIGEVTVEGEDFQGRARLLTVYLPRSGDRFRPAEWDATGEDLLAGAGDLGFPFSRWIVQDVAIDPQQGRIDIAAILIPGRRSYLGPMTSDLPAGRGEAFLLRASGLRQGDLFSHSELSRARHRLEARELYERVDEPWLYLTSAVDTVGLHWPVAPLPKPNRVAVVLGFSQRDSSGGRLSGEVDLRLPNLAGTGRKLAAFWSDDGRSRSRFGFAYHEPFVFRTPLDTDIAVDNEVLTESYTRFTLDNRWQLPIVGLWGLEMGVAWDRVTYPTGTVQRTARLRGRAAFYHRRGDRGRSGWEGSAAIETARRDATFRQLDDPESGTSQLGTATNQRILDVDVAGEHWLGTEVSIAGRAAFRQLTGGDGPAPLAEQFLFGGTRTLRGHREDEFHGETVAYGSVELRLGRAGRSRLYTFFDLGYFEFGTAVSGDAGTVYANREGTPRGFGLGLETRTPAGDVSLAVGFPGQVDFDSAKLHVILLEAF